MLLGDGGGEAFAAIPGGLPARLPLLAARLRNLILDNRYDAAIVADLRAVLDHDFVCAPGNGTLINLLIGRHLVRTLVAGAALFGVDRASAAIYFAIYVESERSVAHDSQLSRAAGWIDNALPAGAMQPVSVRGVARSIGLQAEMVRRRANRLIDKQLIKRVPDGLLLVRTPGVASIHVPRAYQQLLELLAKSALIIEADSADAASP